MYFRIEFVEGHEGVRLEERWVAVSSQVRVGRAPLFHKGVAIAMLQFGVGSAWERLRIGLERRG